MSTLASELNRLGLLKRREEILKRRAKEATAARTEWEAEVYDRMFEEGYEPGESSVKLRGVVYVPMSTDYATVTDRAELITWLREHDEGIIEAEKLREGELNRLVREKLDNGEPMPPGLNYFTRTRVSTRGANKTNEEDTNDDTD